jgi:hypothetical protein
LVSCSSPAITGIITITAMVSRDGLTRNTNRSK